MPRNISGACPALSSFIRGYQTEEPLNLRELWAIPVALKLALLEEILAHASGAFSSLPVSDAASGSLSSSLHEVSLPVWSNILEPLVPFEDYPLSGSRRRLRQMDFDSRDMYRTTLRRSRPDRR